MKNIALGVATLSMLATPVLAQNSGTTLSGGAASQTTGGANKTSGGAEKSGQSAGATNAGADKSSGAAAGQGTTLAGGKNGKQQ